MPNKFNILCDLDGIVADMWDDWIRIYNQTYNDNLKKEDVTEYDIAKFVKKECGVKMYEIINQNNFFRSLKPLKGAIEGLKTLQALGHDITILSSPSRDPKSASDKTSWIYETLPFIGKRDILLGHKKHLVRGDIFIDDCPDNLVKYKENNPLAVTMSISYPYNQSTPVDYLFKDYTQPDKAWNSLVEIVTEWTYSESGIKLK